MNSNLERHRPAAGKAEDGRGRPGGKTKENPLADAVYLIQNENDVLRMKYGFSDTGMTRLDSESANSRYNCRFALTTSR
jgi:hypothetical protein